MKDEALKLALGALESCDFVYTYGNGGYQQFDRLAVDKAISALTQLLEAQPAVQEPQRYSPDGEGGMEVDSLGAYVNLQDVTTPPAAQPALPPMHTSGLVAIKTLLSRDPCAHAKVAIEMIDAMLAAEPQPVPVKTYHDGKPWPVAPKPWVGLTPDDIRQLEKENTVEGYFGDYCPTWDLIEAVETKLKEKNT